MITKPTPTVVEHLVLYDISWELYEAILKSFGNRRLRHSYDNGVLEIMSPMKRHEWFKCTLGKIVELVAFALQLPIQAAGSTTLRSSAIIKGLEPDACYYLSHAHCIMPLQDFNAETTPPPDLVIEVNVSYADVKRNSIYAKLRVPELWVYDDESTSLQILGLRNGKYTKLKCSKELPVLNPEILLQFLRQAQHSYDDNQLTRDVQSWLKQNGYIQ
jgi:Uma2 family endonuclease